MRVYCEATVPVGQCVTLCYYACSSCYPPATGVNTPPEASHINHQPPVSSLSRYQRHRQMDSTIRSTQFLPSSPFLILLPPPSSFSSPSLSSIFFSFSFTLRSFLSILLLGSLQLTCRGSSHSRWGRGASKVKCCAVGILAHAHRVGQTCDRAAMTQLVLASSYPKRCTRLCVNLGQGNPNQRESEEKERREVEQAVKATQSCKRGREKRKKERVSE